MIVDFPDAKRAIAKAIEAVMRQKVHESATMLSLISQKRFFEGDKTSIQRADGTRDVKSFRVVQSEFIVTQEELPRMSQGDMLERISRAAEDMAGQIERGLFDTLNEAAQKSDTVESAPTPLSPDTILKALGKIWIDFEDDDRGKPVKPTIVTGPGAFEALRKQDANATDEEKRQYQVKEAEILDRKYRESLLSQLGSDARFLDR